MTERSIIISAGGVGKRMGANIPKQFLLLAGRPVLMHTLAIFHDFDSESQLILVLPENQIVYWKGCCADFNFHIPHEIVVGGKERFYSVQNGLKVAKGKMIAVHDAVRPLVSKEVIAACFMAAQEYGAAVPIMPVKESIRMTVGQEGSKALDRAAYKLVQTPQCFQTAILKKAYERSYSPRFTDDASLVELDGQRIHLVDGNEENIKITSPIDLKIAEILLGGE